MQPWAKREESKSGLRTAWCAYLWALRTWTICWPIWTRRWLRSKLLPQRTQRNTEKSKDIRNFHRGDAEARREPRNLLLMNTDLKSQRKSQFSPRRRGDTEKSKKRFLPQINADERRLGGQPG